MDILKKEDGTTIMETLVGIIILGITITIVFSLIIGIYSNPFITHKHEAIQLADQEIINCINNKTITDTTYENINNNLRLLREVRSQDKIHTAVVKIIAVGSLREIVMLSASYTD